MSASQLDLENTMVHANTSIPDRVARLLVEGEEVLVLLTLSRNPPAFHNAMHTHGQLQFVRDSLRDAGKSFELHKGYAVIRPDQYEPARKALELSGRSLSSHHVLCSKEYVVDVTDTIKSLSYNSRVRVRRNDPVPHALASQAESFGIDIEVRHSFLNVVIPSSLCSTSRDGWVTVSTSQARGINNHRR